MQKPYYIEFEVRNEEKIYTQDVMISGKSEEMTAISFENIGAVPATINGRPLNPGSGILSYELEIPHIDISDYKLVFDNTTPGSKQVFVSMRKIFKTTARVILKACNSRK
jgi:hypothetical protein